MSAYIVEDKTINRILSKICESILVEARPKLIKKLTVTPEGYQRLANLMHQLNTEAVAQRYSQADEADLVEFKYQHTSPMQAFKSLQCFLYQCSEGNVPGRALFKELEGIKNRWATEIISNLEAYDQAEWA